MRRQRPEAWFRGRVFASTAALALVASVAGGRSLAAQSPVARPSDVSGATTFTEQADRTAALSNTPAIAAASEWVFGVGVARSVRLYGSRPNITYSTQSVSWAREITAEHGPGPLRGRLAMGVEVMPLLVETSPSRVYGFGGAPLLLRWNLVPGRQWSAFGEVAGGALATSSAFPDGTARFNFTAHGGAGVRLNVSANRAVVLAYRFQHISNGDRLDLNPGTNSHMVFVGWGLRRHSRS